MFAEYAVLPEWAPHLNASVKDKATDHVSTWMEREDPSYGINLISFSII